MTDTTAERDPAGREPFDHEHVRALEDRPGVHVVWDAEGQCIYVGESARTRTRMHQHLTGDRQASSLHDNVGQALDQALGRTASRDEIAAWLQKCTFTVEATDHPAGRKRELMLALKPAFNRRLPADRVEERSAANADRQPSADLAAAFSACLDGLRSRHGGPIPQETKRFIRELIPGTLGTLVPAGTSITASTGYGSDADVPWVAVLPPGAAESPRSGVYLVYLFAADGSAVFLSLEQGTAMVTGGSPVLQKRSWDIRRALGQQPDLVTDIDLCSNNPLPRSYEAGSAVALRYTTDTMPESARLADDLQRMLALLEPVRKAGLAQAAGAEPVHLLMKWSRDIRADTIDQHRSVAAHEGSVWWGKIGKPGTNSLSAKRLKMVQDQLAADEPTYCYLYRAGEAWRTRLEAITPNRTDVDERRIPEYYGDEGHSLYLRLSDFQQIPADWPSKNLVLANNPDPDATPGALSNQTSPLLMYQLWSPDTDGTEPRPTPPPTPLAAIEQAAAPPTLDMTWLEAETLCDRSWLEDLVDTLRRRPQVVLAGPPGTGKTWLARAVARYLTQDEPLTYRILQFHPSYGYEEFVEGLRPQMDERGVSFQRVDGAVLRMASQIDEDSDQRYVLVLDEMNRANLPRVFGELMYLLEYRRQPVDLMYTADFSLPEQLLFIGTMNTADRSIRSIDLALRRRFEVFDCPPSAAVLERYYSTRECSVDGLIDGFIKLNDRLTTLLDRHHTVGHSFFMADDFDASRLHSTWERQLQPLFEEYFFDRPDVAAALQLSEFWPDV